MTHIFTTFLAACLSAVSFWNQSHVLGWNNNHDQKPPDNDHNSHLDLTVNGKDHPKKLIYFDDLKPGDAQTYTTTLNVTDNARLYLHLTDLQSSQGRQTEPEIFEEAGTPKSDLQNYLTYSLSPVGISDLYLPDAVSCWIPLGSLQKNHTLSITQQFHFDSMVTNWAQGDRLTFTEEFLAVAKNAPEPETSSGRVWDPASKKCISPLPTPTKKPHHP